MKSLHILVVCAGVLGLAACSTTAQAPPEANLSPQDLDALTVGYQLIQFDLMECDVMSGKEPAPSVAAVADKICKDANDYEPELEQLAQAHKVTLPNTLPDDLEGRYVALHYAPTEERYLDDQISSHSAALPMFEKEASAGTNPELVGVARQIIPVVQANLAALRNTQVPHS